MSFPVRQWTTRRGDPADDNASEQTDFVLSTDRTLLSIPALTAAFAQEYFYWGKPLPAADMQRLIDMSMCFGLYAQPNGEDKSSSSSSSSKNLTLIGFARLVTDAVTFAYLTDVYVLPGYQGSGLGTWMLKCVEEVLADWPHLRRMLLLTVGECAKEYYARTIGAEVLGQRGDHYVLGKRGGGSCF